MKIILALAAIGCLCSAVYAAPANLDDTSSDDDLGELVGAENADAQWFTSFARPFVKYLFKKAVTKVGSRLANRRNGGQEEVAIQDYLNDLEMISTEQQDDGDEEDNTLADAQFLSDILKSWQAQAQQIDDDDSLADAQFLRGLIKGFSQWKAKSQDLERISTEQQDEGDEGVKMQGWWKPFIKIFGKRFAGSVGSQLGNRVGNYRRNGGQKDALMQDLERVSNQQQGDDDGLSLNDRRVQSLLEKLDQSVLEQGGDVTAIMESLPEEARSQFVISSWLIPLLGGALGSLAKRKG